MCCLETVQREVTVYKRLKYGKDIPTFIQINQIAARILIVVYVLILC